MCTVFGYSPHMTTLSKVCVVNGDGRILYGREDMCSYLVSKTFVRLSYAQWIKWNPKNYNRIFYELHTATLSLVTGQLGILENSYCWYLLVVNSFMEIRIYILIIVQCKHMRA